MNKFLFFYLTISIIGYWCVNPARAEYKPSNSHYQAIHIKQMDHRGFTNKGRNKYIYVEQRKGSYGNNFSEIGSVQLGKHSRVRELFIGVDIHRNNKITRLSHKKKISIGRVYGGGSKLKKVHVLINSNGKLHY